MRKHQAALAVVAAFLALLLGVTALSTWLAIRESRAADAERDAKQETEVALTQTRQAQEAAQAAEDQAKKEASQRLEQLIRSNVRAGTRLVEQHNIADATLYFAEALTLAEGDPSEDLHRIRCRSAIRACPKPVMVWHAGRRAQRMKLSRDGRLVVTFDDQQSFNLDSGEANVWEVETGDHLIRLSHDKIVLDAEFSPDGQLVATASADGTARLWDVATGNPVSDPLVHPLNVSHVSFSNDGRVLASGTGHWSVDRGRQREARVRLWDVPGGQLLHDLPHPALISDIAFSHDDGLVATGARDDNARIWKAATGELLYSLEHPLEVESVQFAIEGQLITGCSEHNRTPATCHIWDYGKGVRIFEPIVGFLQDVRADGAQILATTRQTVEARYPHIPDTIWRVPGVGYRQHARLDPTGHLILTVNGSEIRVWSQYDDASETLAYPPLLHTAQVVAAEFLSTGRFVLTLDADGILRLWDLASANPFDSTIRVPDFLHAEVAISPSRSLVAFTATPARVRGKTAIWSAITGSKVGDTIEHTDRLRRATFSPDDRFLALHTTGVRLGAEEVRVIELPTGRELARTVYPDRELASIASVTFSPDSRYLAVAGPGNQAMLYDARTLEAVSSPLRHDQSVRCAVFSNDGSRLMTASGTDDRNVRNGSDRGGSVRVWSVPSGEATGPYIPHEATVSCARFSRSDQWIVTGCRHANPELCTVQIFDSRTAARVGTPMSHPAAVTDVLFLDDERRVASSARDGLARIWSIESSEPTTAPMALHPSRAYRMSQHGSLLLTLGHRWGQVWDMETGEPVNFSIDRCEALSESPTGDLLTVDSTGIHSIRLNGADPPIAEIQLSAQVLSGKTLDSKSGEIAMSASEYLRAWDELMSQVTSWGASSSQLNEWKRREASWHASKVFLAPHPDYELFHSNQALRWLEPDSQLPMQEIEARLHRANALAKQGRWDAAAHDFRIAIGQPGTRGLSEFGQAEWFYRMVQTHLAAGSAVEHRELFNEMARRFDPKANRRALGRLTQIVVVTPALAEDVSDYVSLQPDLEELVGAPKRHFMRMRAALRYRTGKYAESLRGFERSSEQFPPTAWDLAFVAMARFQLDQPGAEEALSEARNGLALPQDRSQRWRDGHVDRMEAELLVHEATELIVSSRD